MDPERRMVRIERLVEQVTKTPPSQRATKSPPSPARREAAKRARVARRHNRGER